MNLTEKAAYLKGLAEGLALGGETKEGKLIAALIDMVDALAAKVEELDEDLGAVEEYLMDECECDCDCDCDCCDCDEDDLCDCDCCDCDDYYEVVCPGCGEVICFDEDIDPENLTCPACNEKFSCDIEEE